MRFRFGVVAVVGALALLATACGDDDSSTPFDGGGFGADDDDEGGDFGDLGDLELPGDVGDIPGLSDDCEAIANVFLSFSSAFFGGDPVDADSSRFDGLPGELRDDADIVVGALNELYEEFDRLGLDLSDPTAFATMTEEEAAAFGELSDNLDSAEVSDAMDNLEVYATAECDQGFG